MPKERAVASTEPGEPNGRPVVTERLTDRKPEWSQHRRPGAFSRTSPARSRQEGPVLLSAELDLRLPRFPPDPRQWGRYSILANYPCAGNGGRIRKRSEN